MCRRRARRPPRLPLALRDRAFSTNLRFRWEYAPGSEIFLVSTDERDITNDRFLPPPTVRGLKNRAFVVKINRLFRY